MSEAFPCKNPHHPYKMLFPSSSPQGCFLTVQLRHYQQIHQQIQQQILPSVPNHSSTKALQEDISESFFQVVQQ